MITRNFDINFQSKFPNFQKEISQDTHECAEHGGRIVDILLVKLQKTGLARIL